MRKTFCNKKNIRFAEEIGTSSTNVSDWVKGRKKPSAAVQNYIAEKYGINLEWLQTGEGEMLDPNRKLPDAKGVMRAIAVPVIAKVPCGYPSEAINDKPRFVIRKLG